jgi:hypothetical protein
VWQDYPEQVEDNRHTKKGHALYERRKETIERVFADGKEKHGLRFTRHNGLAKVKTQVLLTFTVMNLKKPAKLLGGLSSFCSSFFIRKHNYLNLQKKYHELKTKAASEFFLKPLLSSV